MKRSDPDIEFYSVTPPSTQATARSMKSLTPSIPESQTDQFLSFPVLTASRAELEKIGLPNCFAFSN